MSAQPAPFRFGPFYWHEFLLGFCGRLPLLLTTLLLLGTVTAASPHGFGLPALVWHEDPLRQFAVGLAVGLVWVQCLLVGHALRDPATPIRFATYAGTVTACVLVTAAGAWLVMSGLAGLRDLVFATETGDGPPDVATWADAGYGVGLAVGLAVAGLLAAGLVVAAGPAVGDGFAAAFDALAGRVGRLLPQTLGGASLAGLVAAGVGLYVALTGLEAVATRSWAGLWEFGLFQLSVFVLAGYLLVLAILVQGHYQQGVADPERGLRYVWFLGGSLVLMAGTWLEAVASPLLALGLVAFLALPLYGALASVLGRLAPVVVLVAAAAFLIGGLPLYRYPIPGLEDHYAPGGLVRIDDAYGPTDAANVPARPAAPKRPGPLAQNALAPLIPVGKVPHRQASGFKPDDATPHYSAQEKRPLVVVAASGGGIRAAAWTLRVLHHLEADLAGDGIDFPSHVRVVTGASGGMVGASVYVAGLGVEKGLGRPGQTAADLRRRLAKMDDLDERLAGDALTPVVNTLVFRDLPCFLSPWNRGSDRGRRLEGVWRDRLDGLLDEPFAKLKAREEAGEVPALIFSPMLVEDGRRLVISNLELGAILRNEGNQIGTPDDLAPLRDTYSREALELFVLFPDAPATFTLATAARLSASFPYVAPAAHLPTVPRRRVVDAGYYDNYGVGLAAGWLLNEEARGAIGEDVSGVVLIQIRDAPTEAQRRLIHVGPDRSGPLSRSVEQLTSPPEGLWAMRDASSSFRNDALLERLSHLFNGKGKNRGPEEAQRFFTVLNFELPVGDDVPLSWYLTAREKRLIRQTAPYPAWEDRGPGKVPLAHPTPDDPAGRAFEAKVAALRAWWRECDRRAGRP